MPARCDLPQAGGPRGQKNPGAPLGTLELVVPASGWATALVYTRARPTRSSPAPGARGRAARELRLLFKIRGGSRRRLAPPSGRARPPPTSWSVECPGPRRTPVRLRSSPGRSVQNSESSVQSLGCGEFCSRGPRTHPAPSPQEPQSGWPWAGDKWGNRVRPVRRLTPTQ